MNYGLVKRKDFPAVTIARRIHVPVACLDSWPAQQAVQHMTQSFRCISLRRPSKFRCDGALMTEESRSRHRPVCILIPA